ADEKYRLVPKPGTGYAAWMAGSVLSTTLRRKECDMPNSNCENESVRNGSLPTAAAESIDEPMTTSEMEDDDDEPEMGLYDVSLSCRLSLSACVTVYAADEDEAARKVQAKIDAESLDDDLEMENYESGRSIPFRDVKAFFEYGLNELRIQNVE